VILRTRNNAVKIDKTGRHDIFAYRRKLLHEHFLGGVMDRRQILILLVLKELGIPLATKDWIIAQKAIYLTQELGVSLGYFYKWYSGGPLCPTDEPGLENEIGGWQLSHDLKEKLGQVKTLVETKLLITKLQWLELLSAVHFLNKRALKKRVDEQQMIECIKGFSVDQVKTAIVALKKARLL